MYQAGPAKIASQITKDGGTYVSEQTASEHIDNYFKKFHKLKDWINLNKAKIKRDGFIHSYFGRKRRLPNVFSDNSGISGHAVRSGINFLVQSVASDANLLGAIEAQNYLNAHPEIDAKIFALVHDSILAEVKDEHVDEYCSMLRSYIQKDRGINIPGTPIGCDFEIGDDYSFGKYEKYEAYWDNMRNE